MPLAVDVYERRETLNDANWHSVVKPPKPYTKGILINLSNAQIKLSKTWFVKTPDEYLILSALGTVGDRIEIDWNVKDTMVQRVGGAAQAYYISYDLTEKKE